jgi:hypothetical protein
MGNPTEQQLKGGSANKAVDHPSDQLAAVLNRLDKLDERIEALEIVAGIKAQGIK